MTANGLLQITIYFLVLVALAKPLGLYITKVMQGERTFMHRVLRPLEAGIYKLCGIDEHAEQHWTSYAGGILLFSVATLLVSYVVLRIQQWLPWNPAGLGNVGPDLSFNTAMSFTTNTNWQSYTPETTMSYFSQMAALAFHNWVSAATGIAIAVALVRGLARRSGRSIGNFWVDLVRCTLYVLLPVLFFYTLFLIWQGVPQNLSDYTVATTVEGATQTIAQ